MQRKLWLLALAGAILLSVTPVLADGDIYVMAGGGGVGTKISSLPYTISASGFYYLGSNLTSTGNGITVSANDVTLDLMGFKITGPGTANSYGIYMSSCKNVQIRNGTVTNFYNGIYAADSSNTDHRITNIRALSNKNYGILLSGGDHVIQNCHASSNTAAGIMSMGMVFNCVAQLNGGAGIGSTGAITNCSAGGNKGDGIVISSGPGYPCTILNNTSYHNVGYGFRVAGFTVVDRNSATSNTGGNYSAGDATTLWGLNAGK